MAILFNEYLTEISSTVDLIFSRKVHLSAGVHGLYTLTTASITLSIVNKETKHLSFSTTALVSSTLIALLNKPLDETKNWIYVWSILMPISAIIPAGKELGLSLKVRIQVNVGMKV